MAAGLGFKTFTTGEVLTAADTNGYLMQGVLVFATAAARDAAITSPQEGQFAFTKDTNGLWYYDGAAWVASGATGDIEGVTAGTGISGGGTSGTVTVTNSMATAITTNGDVIYGTGSGTFSRLGIGSSAQVLTVAGGVPSWATPAGGSTFSGCQIYLTSDTSLANATQATINWGSESFDTDSYHSTSTDTDRITIPAGKSGKFLVYGQWTIAAGTGFRGTDVRLNGSSYLHIGQVVNCSATAGDEPNMLFSFVADLVATDYLTMRIYQNSGASKTYFSQAYYTRFGVAYLGA